MTTELDFILARYGSPDITISIDSILMRVTIHGLISNDLQKDLALYYRETKPGFMTFFDTDFTDVLRAKRRTATVCYG